MSFNEEFENNVIESEGHSLEQNQPELGMKWFKYLIYFALFLGAADDLLSAISMFFGIRNDLFEMEYYFEGNLRWLGILFGVLWVITAAAVIYIRFDLAKFRKGAPKRYIIIEIIGAAVYLLYNLAGIILVGNNETPVVLGAIVGAIVGSVIGNFILIYLSIIYFRKRDHLFVN